jgi:hypothetical protein
MAEMGQIQSNIDRQRYRQLGAESRHPAPRLVGRRRLPQRVLAAGNEGQGRASP